MIGRCVLVAELARARIFTLESAEVPEAETSPFLVERHTLANPEQKAHERDLWTDTRRGAHREHRAGQIAGRTTGIPHQNFDEHREQNLREHNRKFVQDVVAHLESVVTKHNIRHVVLCAEKQMLGFLRSELDGRVPHQVKLDVLAKDLASLSHHELHKKLAGEGFLPVQKRPHIPGQSPRDRD